MNPAKPDYCSKAAIVVEVVVAVKTVIVVSIEIDQTARHSSFSIHTPQQTYVCWDAVEQETVDFRTETRSTSYHCHFTYVVAVFYDNNVALMEKHVIR